MPAEGPIFVDQFGATPTLHQPLPEPWWKAGWHGRMQLWLVFWVCFVFGHGVVIGLGSGLMVIAMVLGFTFNSGSLSAGVVGLAAGATVLALVYLTFLLWSGVSVWRCADNCVEKRWRTWARGVIVVYGLLLMVPVFSWLIDGTE